MQLAKQYQQVGEKDYIGLRPSQGLWGTGGQWYLFQWNKCLKMKGTGAQRQFWGTGNIGNRDFNFGEHRNKAIYFKGLGIPAPPTPTPPGWPQAIFLRTSFDL